MYNNVSYRRYNVSGTGSPFSFSPAAATQRTKAAISAWTGASLAEIKPDPANDGIGMIAYKVTNPSPGVWHYEYAIYNQNLDRAIQSFSVPIGSGSTTLNNIGFHAPPQHPGWAADGTVGNSGYSSTPWQQSQTAVSMTWSSETLAQNPNANAIRWGTMYNFRFDSNRPPQNINATVGFFKTGAPMNVMVQGPAPSTVSIAGISGRVTVGGLGVVKASVILIDSQGNRRAAITSPFGYYSFTSLPANGETYTIGVLKKGYTFNDQVIQLNEEMVVNFESQP
jgi:hypothetical protein